MKDLQLALLQSNLHWQNIDANLAMFEEQLWQLPAGSTDLIVLPEMFSTGFTMDAAPLAEPMNSKTFRWLKQQAAQFKAVVTGSFIVKEQQRYYNRLVWMRPDGTFSTYDKRHLFRMAQEHQTYTAGGQRLVETLHGWRICPLICYDLRFPVWSRNQLEGSVEMAFDVLLYVANWPAARVQAWDVLLQARAIENLCYVAGVNRTGQDGNEVAYNGHTVALDFKGQALAAAHESHEAVLQVTFSAGALNAFRQKFPANQDMDRYLIQA